MFLDHHFQLEEAAWYRQFQFLSLLEKKDQDGNK